MSVRLPRLMDGNMQELRRLHPSALSAQLNLQPLSTASMCLPEGEEGVGVRAFVEVYGPDGSLGVYRVASIGTAYGTEQRVNLEHGITTLGDDVTEADTDLTGSVRDIMSAILACQSTVRWKLGAVEATGEDYTLPVNRSNVLDALLSAAELEEGCMLSFDQSAYPWTVNLRKMDSTVASECRISRNMAGVTISLDDASLCTRVYSEYLPDGYMDADTVAAWGVVAQGIALEEPVEAGDEVDLDNRETARRYLDENKNPAVSIEIDAVELSGLTGEPLDRFALGSVCRMALPDYGVTMDERTVGMSYGDLLNAPESVRLTLSTPQKNASVALASLRQQVRVTTKQVLEQHKHITERENELLLHAELINAKAESVEVTAIGKRVSKAEMNIDSLNGQIDLKASVERVAGLEKRVTNAEINVDGLNGEVSIKASQEQLDNLQADVEEQLAFFDVSYDHILQQLYLNGEVMTQINATVDGIDAWSKDTEGNLDELLLTATGIKNKVTDVEGNVGLLVQSSEEFRNTLMQGDTVLSEIEQLQDQINLKVNDANGTMGRLSVKADSITQKIESAGNQISQLQVKTDGMTYTLEKAGETLALFDVNQQHMLTQIGSAASSIGLLEVTANAITQKVEDVNKGVGQFQVTADRISGSVQDLDGRVGSLELRSNSFDVAIGKDGLGGKINMIEGLLDLKVEGGGNTVSVRLDAFDKSIELKADTTYVNKLVADEIKAVKGSFDELLAGYVTTENVDTMIADMAEGYALSFSTTDLYASEAHIGATLTAEHVSANTVSADNINFGGSALSWKSKRFVTAVTVLPTYKQLADGTFVVTGVTPSLTHETINYLG